MSDNSVDERGRGGPGIVIRFFAIAVALALIGCPLFLIYGITVPVERFRTGGYVDFLAFAGTAVALYGGVVLGVAVHRVRTGRKGQRGRPFDVLKAGVWGAFAVGVVFVLGAGVRGLITQGSFEKGIGNLWGLIVIFAVLLGSLVSAGVALMSYGLRASPGAGGHMLENSTGKP